MVPMSLLHGFDIHLKLFQLKVHLGMRKISLYEFSFLKTYSPGSLSVGGTCYGKNLKSLCIMN